MNRPSRARRRAGKYAKTALLAAGVFLSAVVGVLAFVGYRVSHPRESAEAVSPTHYLLTARDLTLLSRDGTTLAGYWIAGAHGAPAVVLATGYGMSRSDGLSLAAALNREGFSVLLFAMRGSGEKPRGASWLGLREAADVEAAFDLLEHRTDIDRARMGVWGVDVGARAALSAAGARSSVRVIVADSPFDQVSDFLALRVREDLGVSSALLNRLCGWGLRIVEAAAAPGGGKLELGGLSDREVLILHGRNRPAMEPLAVRVHGSIVPTKSLMEVRASRVRLMAGEELRDYDAAVVEFFRLHLRNKRAGAKPGK